MGKASTEQRARRGAVGEEMSRRAEGVPCRKGFRRISAGLPPCAGGGARGAERRTQPRARASPARSRARRRDSSVSSTGLRLPHVPVEILAVDEREDLDGVLPLGAPVQEPYVRGDPHPVVAGQPLQRERAQRRVPVVLGEERRLLEGGPLDAAIPPLERVVELPGVDRHEPGGGGLLGLVPGPPLPGGLVRLRRGGLRGRALRLGAGARERGLEGPLPLLLSREAQAVEEAARARDAAAEAQRAREKAEGALAAAQATDAAAEAQRARAAAREAEGKVTALEARLARQEERERELEAALARVRAEPERASPQAVAPEPEEPEEVPATWLMPVYTREFYDSLEGWDRRIQRAAFKQAQLLAQDHRHPSLRALPLEGLPGYYRVRVATDVRLLYRRTSERQNTIEILSLIDREDLDRYVRQAKTRA